MNSILAQIRKDLYLNRYIIIAYLAFQVYGIVLQWDILGLFNSPGIGPMAASFFGPESGFIAFLVATFIFLTDPDTHTDAFCLTRPLNPRKRTGAKIILISAVLFAPIIISNLLYSIRYGGNFFSRASEDIAFYLFAFVGIGMASLSRSIPRLIINMFGIMISSMIVLRLIRSLLNGQGFDSPSHSVTELWAVNQIAGVLNPILAIIFISVALLPHKVRLRTYRVGLSSALLFAVANLTIERPNFNPIKPRQIQTSPTQFQVAQRAFFEPDVYVGRQGPNAKELKSLVKFELEGIQTEVGTDVIPLFLSGQLEVDGRVLLPSYDFHLYKSLDAFSFSPRSFESGFEGIQLLNKDQFESKDPISFTAIDISNETISELSGKHASYRGRVGLISTKYSEIATIPLNPSSSFKAGYYFGQIDAVNKQDRQLDVSATIAATIIHFDRASPAWTRIPGLGYKESGGREFLLLYNSKTNQALIPETLRTRSDYVTRSQKIWNAAVSKYELSFKRDETITDEWLENAELLIVEKKVVRYQDEDFTVKNITL